MKFYPQGYIIMLLMVCDVLKYQQKEEGLLKGQKCVDFTEENSCPKKEKAHANTDTVWPLYNIFSKTFQWEIKANTSIKFS